MRSNEATFGIASDVSWSGCRSQPGRQGRTKCQRRYARAVRHSTTQTLNLSDLTLLAGRVLCAPRVKSMFKKLAATSFILALSISAVSVGGANADPMMHD